MDDRAKLRGAVTRTSRQFDKILAQYGANDIPESHPLHAKAVAAKQKHRAATQALREHEQRE
jgi:hypothetical protein